MPESPRKGDIYRLMDGGTPATKPRQVLVLSRLELNGGTYLIAAPFTTQKLDVRIGKMQFVLFEASECGLPDRCVLQLDAVTRIKFRDVNTRDGRIGQLTDDKILLVEKSLKYVFDLG